MSRTAERAFADLSVYSVQARLVFSLVGRRKDPENKVKKKFPFHVHLFLTSTVIIFVFFDKWRVLPGIRFALDSIQLN